MVCPQLDHPQSTNTQQMNLFKFSLNKWKKNNEMGRYWTLNDGMNWKKGKRAQLHVCNTHIRYVYFVEKVHVITS